MNLEQYANKVANLHVFKESPEEVTRNYSKGWRNVLKDIRWAGNRRRAKAKGGGLYEVTGVVMSRWEYLGLLYVGHGDGVKNAYAYAKRFLAGYDHVHDLSGKPRQPDQSASDFFDVFRNNTLHCFTPAGIMKHGTDEVVSWKLGAVRSHLRVDASVHIDCTKLYEDLCDSMLDFADYLEADADILHKQKPSGRWKRGMWRTFCPHGLKPDEWMNRGVNDWGIPARA